MRNMQVAAMAAMLFSAATSVQAQSGSLFGNNGVTSGSSGQSRSGSTSSGTGAQGGAGGYGASGGIVGFTGQTASSSQGYLSGAQGGSGFVGQSGNFVGDRNASNAATSSGTGTSAGGGARGAGGQRPGGGNNFGGGQGGFGQNGFGQNNDFGMNGGGGYGSSTSQQRVVRPRLESAFSYTPRPVQQVQTAVATQISRLPGPQFEGVTVLLDEKGEVTLRGHLATDGERKLAAAMARIEPGVRNVTNEITVENE